jgi:EmrB/QacA subfamily drug resistance transporter
VPLLQRFRDLPYKWKVATVFVIGLFMDIIDTTIVNVAIPQLAKDFKVTSSGIEWVVTGYLLSLAVWIPASGWLGDRFGTKRIFVFALTMFTFASALCALAWSVESLVAFRVLQGVGGGMLTPVGTAMLFRAFPPNERTAAATVLTIPTVVAPAVGPVLGGFLVTKVSWHWIFLVNVPIGILGIFIAVAVLEEHREPSAGSFDVPGFVLSGAGLALVLYALSRGPLAGWRSTEVLATGLAGLASFAALVAVELRSTSPMLDLRLFRDRIFRTMNLVSTLAFGSLIGLLFLLPLYLQSLRGFTALQSGLATFPQAIGVILCSRLVVTKTLPRFGPKPLLLIGIAGLAVSTMGFAFVGLDTSPWIIRALMFVRGLFFAPVIVSVQAASFVSIRPQDTGRASSLFSTVRQVGAALGVAVVATSLASRSQARVSAVSEPSRIPSARLAAFHDSFWVSVVVLALAFVMALTIDNGKIRTLLAGRSTGEPAH